MKSKEELKKLFENGDKPTQEEFWEWQDSYWHKDEKLPTEAAGIYKIKGSVANLAALNALTGMEEGDVYNLLDTGDNYVYVLDLNNTGVAGWDKLSGIIDLSTVDLQTVLDNGGYASNGNSIANFDLENGIFQMSISSVTGYENTQILQSSDNIYITKTTMSGVPTQIEINQGGFLNGEDYSQRPEFGDRNLVDKGYVDNAIINVGGNNFIPLTGTNQFNGFISNSDESIGFGIDSNSGYKRITLYDSNVPDFAGRAFSLFANIEEGFSVGNFTGSYNRGSIGVSNGVEIISGYSDEVTIPTSFRYFDGRFYSLTYNAPLSENDYIQKKYVDNATKRTKGEITTITNVGSGSVIGVVSYEHEEGSDYFIVRLNISGSFPDISDFCYVTFPFEIGISDQNIINNFTTLRVYTEGTGLVVRRLSEENVQFNIRQSFIIPYGFEATSN